VLEVKTFKKKLKGGETPGIGLVITAIGIGAVLIAREGYPLELAHLQIVYLLFLANAMQPIEIRG
jgi:hypothetical protein